jgi:hypothetical protein
LVRRQHPAAKRLERRESPLPLTIWRAAQDKEGQDLLAGSVSDADEGGGQAERQALEQKGHFVCHLGGVLEHRNRLKAAVRKEGDCVLEVLRDDPVAIQVLRGIVDGRRRVKLCLNMAWREEMRGRCEANPSEVPGRRSTRGRGKDNGI